MLLVIFGAGASHDAVSPLDMGSLVKLPPLSRDLFDERGAFSEIINRYTAVRVLVPRLRAAAHDDNVSIEHEFEDIVAESRDRVPVRRQLLAARFYIHDAIKVAVDDFARDNASGVTNYHLLVNRLNAVGDPVLYVTFNYDRLLETALTDCQGHEFVDISSYIYSDQLKVIKLHGSVGWRRRLDGAIPPVSGGDRKAYSDWVLAQLHHLTLTDEYEVGPLGPLIQGQSVHQPAIAVPTERKTAGDFELPQAHLGALQEWLPEVSQILVIGWRGMEDHFWELWQRCRPGHLQLHVEVVDADQAQATKVAMHLRDMGMSDLMHPSEAAGFSKYIELRRLR
jgi:hypothetical protein